MLDEDVLPELESRISPERMSSCWFQQDRAAIHTSEAVRDYLRGRFANRIISLKIPPIEWPPCSPDLNPLAYWFWARMKAVAKRHEPENLEEMKIILCYVCTQLTVAEVARSINEFPIRLLALQEDGLEIPPTNRTHL